MISERKNLYSARKGVALIVAMLFLAMFGALAVAMTSMSSANIQSSSNQRAVSNALASAQSGLECAKYLVSTVTLASTNTNTVSAEQADTAWADFCEHIQNHAIGGATVTPASGTPSTQILVGSSDSLVSCDPCNPNAGFWLSFTRAGAGATSIAVTATGIDGPATQQATRKVGMSMSITKDAKVLQYAIASRGRMWITGDSTIHGSVYSAWNLSNSQLAQLTSLEDSLKAYLAAGTLTSTNFYNLISSLSLSLTNRTTIRNELLSGALSPKDAAARCIGCMSSAPSVSPFNMTSDSTVLGSINTCWSADQVDDESWQFETWDAYGNPVYQTDGLGNIIYLTDGEGNYLRDDNGEMIAARVVGSDEEIQGICAGINYGVAPDKLAGMDITDYDTTEYYSATLTANGGGGNIPKPSSSQFSGTETQLYALPATCGTKYRYEYFPHNSGSYTSGTGIKVKRYIYKDQTFTNAMLTSSATSSDVYSGALFINCTFEGVTYVDCGTSSSTSYYNNVRFDGCTFNGTLVSDTPQSFKWQQNALYFTGSATFQNDTSEEATILAPHFNVNLGNTNPVAGTENVLRGAIVGGIVDVRGNAEVFGTIISMADTSSYTSGYVTNIGATLDDGGSETVAIGDVGTINITPDADNRLPSGITTPIVIKPDQSSYDEIL